MTTRCIPIFFPALLIAVCFSSCRVQSKYCRTKGETTAIVVSPTLLDTSALAIQTMAYNDPTAADRMRGDFFDPTGITSTAIGLVATGLKNAINKEQKKYQVQYDCKIGGGQGRHISNDSLYFYSTNSRSGPFDFRGMQFHEFSVTRWVKKKKQDAEIAMQASFELDTSNLCEIAYDGIFRLKLKSIMLNYAKAKLAHGRKKVNLDIQVQILASYITKDGQFYSDAVIGTFTKNLPGITVGDTNYYDSLKDKNLSGWSFVVPRSYYHSIHGDMWNKGAYSISVTVKETSKQRLVKRITAHGSGQFIDAGTKGVNVKTLMPTGKKK